MTDVGRHPNIELMTLSEVESIKGYVGNFHVTVRKKARYIDEKECTACGDCVLVCPVLKPDEFELGLSSRKAVYIPFPQAVPSAYVLNPLDCLGQDPLICGKCKEACEKQCIDYDMQDEVFTFGVGTIVVATGMEPYDPTPLDEYGYTRFTNIMTTLEFERLINAGGPTKGEVLRLSDLKVPKSVAFIQCVGSRSPGNPKANPYCSNICCMNTIKDTLMLKEHYPHMEVKVFYMDIRAFGKGFEDLYHRSKGKGVKYIRGLPGDVQEDPESKDLVLFVENTSTDRLEKHHVEMVVLSQGLVPSEGMVRIQEMLSLQKTSDGFYLEAHPKLQPVDSASKGVFFAGTAEGPKDIKDAATQASAAAARAARVMSPGKIRVEALTSRVDSNRCTSCGICAKVCPYNAIMVDKKNKQPAVVIEAACAGCGTCAAECPFDAIEMNHFTDAQILSQVQAILEEEPQEKVVCFACNWCSYAGADFAGVSRLNYPPNVRLIRTMCSGRVDEKFIWEAFKSGAPAVLVSGCHFGDCHYIDANHWTQKRVEKIWKKMETWGLRKERLQLEWISAAEGIRFSQVMAKMEEVRKGVTKQEIAETKKMLKQELKKKRRKAAPRGENQRELGRESEGKVL
ncbi:MAG: hydrogenase iron-sulfur subunit [Desulfobacteraceae bacterium]|jgi:heterodisulfide reductase subunit A